MAIRQIIEYRSTNSYFAGFLQSIINESGINASVEQQEGKIVLMLDEKDSHLEEFNLLVNRYLPHSIFLGEISTEQVEASITPSALVSKDYFIAPCAKCMELINTPSSEFYLDGNLKCSHYNNEAQSIYPDSTIFSPHYSEGATLLLTNASKVHELFIMTDDELKALFSIEKPTLKVTIADTALQEMTGKKFISIKAPYNNKSLLASINANESRLDYLFFHQANDLEVVVVQKNLSIITASRMATPLKPLHEDSIINRFLNIKQEAKFNNAIGCYLSTHDISFIVANEMGVKRVINFGAFNPTKVMECFHASAKRTKLLENFGEKYPAIVEQLGIPPQERWNEEKKLNSEMGLFETIATILELEPQNYTALSDASYQFRGNGGLKIDTHFNEEGDFDYANLMGSIMSFRLAGVDTHYLAYSIFEALGDMGIEVMNQLKTKFKINHFIMMGNLFGNSVLYSRILSKFQLSSPYFSKAFALDDA
ncbi:MAG: hydrogenase [Campylobacterales bacterium]|nr:hydrogenase [Campylobacterales bacterium]